MWLYYVIIYLQTQQQLHKGVSSGGGSSGGGGGVATSFLLPLGGDIFHSLQLFCVPALKPLLWSASISSFGLYAPVFLMVIPFLSEIISYSRN